MGMETWREVPDRPGYLVSSEGRAAKLMSSKPGPLGYIQQHVPKPGGGRWRDYRHHWVLRAFKGEKPYPEAVARHLNDVRDDNRAENLEWGSWSENQMDWRRRDYTPITVCKRGHVLAEVGTYEGNRCRKCRIDRARRQREGVIDDGA